MAITDFLAALDETRGKFDAVNTAIDVLDARRRAVENAAPHTDDIVSAFQRGLSASADDFERQLAGHLQSRYRDADGSAAKAAEGAPLVLTVEPKPLTQEERMDRSLRGESPMLNTAALSYFLHGAIAAELPALVDRLCPAARAGMTAAARQEALGKLAAERAVLVAERDRLGADLQAARAAVHGR